MNQKEMALNEAKQYQKSIQAQQANAGNADDETDDDSKTNKASKREQTLLNELKAERQKMAEKDYKIEQLLMQLEQQSGVQHEKNDLEKELDDLQSMAQQDLEMMKLQMEKMSNEILYLSSRNSALDQEKEDLMALLEEREYEAQMLKTGFAAHRSNTQRASGLESHDQFASDSEAYNENFE